jgi:hypothetical protein
MPFWRVFCCHFVEYSYCIGFFFELSKLITSFIFGIWCVYRTASPGLFHLQFRKSHRSLDKGRSRGPYATSRDSRQDYGQCSPFLSHWSGMSSPCLPFFSRVMTRWQESRSTRGRNKLQLMTKPILLLSIFNCSRICSDLQHKT